MTRSLGLTLLTGLSCLVACSGAGDAAPDRGVDGSPAVEAGFRGLFALRAGTAMFTDCATGVTYPMAGDHAAESLAETYVELESGANDPLLVGVRGYVAMRPGADGGSAPTFVARTFERVYIGQGCGGDGPRDRLAASEWAAVELNHVPAPQGGGGPTLLLDGGGSVVAWSGCGEFFGSYTLVGGRLRFDGIGAMGESCSGGRASTEAAFLEVLERTRGFGLQGDTLILMGESGAVGRFVAS